MLWLLSQSTLTTINWLWVAGAGIAAWMMVSAMNRRQTRLTQLLRDHVDRTIEKPETPETVIKEEPTED